MKLLKRILAILALISAAVFVVMTIVLLVMGKMTTSLNLIIWPLTIFLGLGLLCLAINWVQNLIREAREERSQR